MTTSIGNKAMVMDVSRRNFVKLVVAGTALEPLGSTARSSTALEIENVLIEWQLRPLALDTLRPRIRWSLTASSNARGVRQSAFRLTIIDEHNASVFDTGRSPVAEMAFQPQHDLPLQSQRFYRYRLQVWDQNKLPLPPATGTFSTGLLTPASQRGKWLAQGADIAPRHAIEGRQQPVEQATPLPLFRKFFHIEKPVQYAHLCIAGLGHYQLWIDDEKVSPDGLNGGWTNYDKRVLYDAYDVTAQLVAGQHRLGVALGNGFFNVEQLAGRYSKLDGTFGRPQMWFQLRIVYADGSEETVGSDADCQTRAGGTVYSSIYGGEDYDARVDDGRFGGNGWTAPTVISGPTGRLQASSFRPMVVRRSLPPKSAAPLRSGGIVYDFGLNHAGRPHIHFNNLQPGTVIRMVPAELLGDDGGADQQSMVGGDGHGYSGIAFNYTARGGADESWSPQFTYTGYRYLQVDGAEPARIARVESLFLSADVDATGSFTCSDARMEQIHGLIQQALLSNSSSVLTDCPHREKLGWLEQIYLNAATALMNRDMIRIYEKMAADIRDAQGEDGKIPTIAPEFIKFLDKNGNDTNFRDSPEWGAALILGAWAVYRLHGELGILQQNYEAMTRRVAFMESRVGSDGLIDYGLGDWFDIGPQQPGVAQLTSRKMTGTATYYAELTTLAEIARRLGTTDAARYTNKAKAIRQTMQNRLFDPARATYDTGSQTAQAMALVLGLLPEPHRDRALAVLVADIRRRQNHVSAGDIGFHYVVRALTDGGRSDVLYDMLKRTDKPAYLEQVKNGSTALTEAWDGLRSSSQNHFMLGHAEIWFYQGLGGLNVDFSRRDAPISLAPQAVEGIVDQAAGYGSSHGRIACRLRQDGRHWRLNAEIPPGQIATITLPRATPAAVKEGNTPLAGAKGIDAIKKSGNATLLTVQSGIYEFSWMSA